MANDHDQQKQLLIPETIKVGYQKRDDTYTGKLAYVIYTDHKGVLRKATSWESWRDKKITASDYNNEPTDGFVLNRGVGGARRSYGWNARNEYIRVYDPRGFEFEISIANLLFILREGACSPGKGLEGQFVYAWDGTELVLLPVASQDYQNCKQFTDLQSQGVHAKDLVDGASYTTKKQDVLTYLGKFDYYFVLEMQHRSEWNIGNLSYTLQPRTKADTKGQIKLYVFWNGKDFVYLKELKSLAVRNGDAIADDYAKLVDKYNKSAHGSKVVKLFLKDVAESKKDKEGYYYQDDPWYIESEDGSFIECRTNYERKWNAATGKYNDHKISGVSAVHRYFINDDGVFTQEPCSIDLRPDAVKKSTTPTLARLFVETENGGKVRVDKLANRYYKNALTKDI